MPLSRSPPWNPVHLLPLASGVGAGAGFRGFSNGADLSAVWGAALPEETCDFMCNAVGRGRKYNSEGGKFLVRAAATARFVAIGSCVSIQC